MQYTSRTPTKPGYYFFRFWQYNNDTPAGYVIRIYESQGGLFVDDGRGYDQSITEYGKVNEISPVKCEYAGPIPEPR